MEDENIITPQTSKSSQYAKTFYEKHPEKRYKRNEYNKKWKAKQIATNKDAFLEKRRLIMRNNYAKNKNRINELRRLNYAKNREQLCKNQRDRYSNQEVSYYEKNREKILDRLKKQYHEKHPNAKYRQKTDKSVIPLPENIEKPIPKVTKQKKGKTRLKQRLIDNNLKKLQLKAEQFKNDLLTNIE